MAHREFNENIFEGVTRVCEFQIESGNVKMILEGGGCLRIMLGKA